VKERRGSGEIASVLARFSTLEGYASRNRRNGVGFSRLKAEKRPATVSVLVWKWNEGRREAGTWAFVRVCIDKVRFTA
jgi:hypothetical protein